VASERQISRLALVTPFDNMTKVAQARYPWLSVRALIKDRYESDHYLAKFRGPILIVRAGHDPVLGWTRTQGLIDALPQPPQVLELPKAGHNSVQEFPTYAQALEAYFR
jgi:pimeloyl-ACP methyl ester carboxylesterase